MSSTAAVGSMVSMLAASSNNQSKGGGRCGHGCAIFLIVIFSIFGAGILLCCCAFRCGICRLGPPSNQKTQPKQLAPAGSSVHMRTFNKGDLALEFPVAAAVRPTISSAYTLDPSDLKVATAV